MLVRHGIFPGSYSSTLTLAYEDIEHLKTLGRTAQSELGTWIRDKIRQSVTQKEKSVLFLTPYKANADSFEKVKRGVAYNLIGRPISSLNSSFLSDKCSSPFRI